MGAATGNPSEDEEYGTPLVIGAGRVGHSIVTGGGGGGINFSGAAHQARSALNEGRQQPHHTVDDMITTQEAAQHAVHRRAVVDARVTWILSLLLPGVHQRRWREEWVGELYDLRAEGARWWQLAAQVAAIVWAAVTMAVILRRPGRAVE